MNSSFWDFRYNESDGLAYGEDPNNYLKSIVSTTLLQLPKDTPILCLAEGQGRNAFYLAQMGFTCITEL